MSVISWVRVALLVASLICTAAFLRKISRLERSNSYHQVTSQTALQERLHGSGRHQLPNPSDSVRIPSRATTGRSASGGDDSFVTLHSRRTRPLPDDGVTGSSVPDNFRLPTSAFSDTVATNVDRAVLKNRNSTLTKKRGRRVAFLNRNDFGVTSRPRKGTILGFLKSSTSASHTSFWLRSNIALCGVKYGPDVVDMLRQQIQVVRGVKRVAIVAILRGFGRALDHWAAAVLQVIDILHPRNVFVSIVESNSKDESSGMLLALKVRLSQLGVPFVVSVNNSRLANTLREDRIDFLARMRNLALQPVVDLTMHANHSFDRVVFLNDVVLCGGDILRLLAHDADMACGADFEQDGFYDHWVMEWEPGYVMDWDRRRFPMAPLSHHEASLDYTVPVFACWNGAVAFRGDVIRYGVRFRRSMLELGDAVDCAQSECSLFALDLHRLGFHRIVLDASVHVAYSVELFTMWARDTHPQVKYHVVTPQKNGTSRTDWRCCPLDRGELLVQSSKCRMVQRRA